MDELSLHLRWHLGGSRCAIVAARFVSAGQVLVHMDTKTLEAQRREAEAQLERATIGVDTAGAVVKQREAQMRPNITGRTVVWTTPILLTHTPTRCRVIPVAGIKLDIGRRLCVASDAEQRTEGVERVGAPVEPKREFVEVGL